MKEPLKTGNPWIDILTSTEVIAALLGALVGGMATYLGTSYFEYRKQRKLELCLCSLVIVEIMRNLDSVELALYRVMRLWLQRKWDGYKPGFTLDYSLTGTSTLSSRIYNQYFETLARTEQGVYLIAYYDRHGDYNHWASKQPITIPGQSLRGYVESLTLLMERGIDLVERIRMMKGMKRFLSEQHQLELENFDEAKKRRKLKAAFFRTDEQELRNLINGDAVEKSVPKEVREATIEELKDWI
jgi:hypothetical protein